jgi:methionyl aminopeptidase
MTEDQTQAFEKTRLAGSIAAGALDEICHLIKPGVTTEKIDAICFEFINDNKAYSAPLFYRGFPKSCCTSSNHVVCHGIPTSKVLNEGDIVNVDVTAIKDGWHGDTSRMFYVGDVSVKSKKLVETTYSSMMKAIKLINSNTRFC